MKPRPDRWPHHLEKRLAARLRRRARAVRTLVLEHLAGLVHRRHDSTRADSWLGDAIRALAARIRTALGIPIDPASLDPIGAQVEAAVTRAVVADLDADPADLVAAGTRATRDAIRLWAEATATRIAEAEAASVDRAVEAAATAADAGDDPLGAARDALRSAEDRAALLARDATGDLVAPLTQLRATQLRSTQFVWVTQHDDRVRELHVELDGQVFDWSTGHPTEGLPGQPPNCRCAALPLSP